MDYLTIVNVVYFVVVGFFVFIGIFVGLSRGLVKSLSRLICLIISVLAAMLLTMMLVNLFGPKISQALLNLDFVRDMLANLGEITEASPTLTMYAPTLLLSAIAPIVFVLLFIVLALFNLILGKVFNYLFGKMIPNEKSGLSRLFGMLISMVCGVVISACLLMPVTGYLVNASKTYKKLEAENIVEPNNDQGKNIAKALRGADGLIIVKAEDAMTSYIFTFTSSYVMPNGVSGNFVSDVNSFIDIIPSVMNLSAMDFSDIENIDLTPLRGILAGIKENQSVSAIIAELLSYASGKWINNEPFMELNIKEELPEDIKDSFDPALEKLNATTKDTVTDDLNDFIDEIEALAKAYPAVREMSEGDYSDPKKIDVTPFETIIDAIDNTTIAKAIVANIIAKAGEKWVAGQDFMGLNIEEQLPEELKGILTPAYETFASSTKDTVVDNIRSFVKLLTDVKNIAVNLMDLTEQGFDASNLASVDETPVRAVAALVEQANSPLTKQVVASLISKAGETWLNGDSFMGLNIKDSVPDDYKNSFDNVLEFMKDTTADTVVEDIRAFADCIATVVESYKNA